MAAYYNEIDPYAAQWLRNLIAKNLIAAGDVDERSIVEVKADDLQGYTQCHFFAGIGGWSIALRYAMWSDDRPVWTGSCPCQPFSSAGKQAAQSDERNLWPHWARLIRESKPSKIYGEQVASAIAFGWYDDVAADLEKEGYACAAAVLPACSVGAPHRRDRLWFVANTNGERCNGRGNNGERGQVLFNKERNASQGEQERERRLSGSCKIVDIATNAHNKRCKRGISQEIQRKPRESREFEGGFKDFNNGWSVSAPKLCSVDDGIPNRTPKLRAYGNAIVPQIAAEFIKATM